MCIHVELINLDCFWGLHVVTVKEQSVILGGWRMKILFSVPKR